MLIHNRIGTILLIFTLVGVTPLQCLAEAAKKPDITVVNLNGQIKDKKDKITDLRKQIDVYKKNISARQAEKVSLENEISIIEDKVAQKELDAQAMQHEIDELALEIQQADIEIQNKSDEIELHKTRLAEFVRRVYEQNDRDVIELIILNENFSQFYDTMKDFADTQEQVKNSLAQIKQLKEQLSTQRSNLDAAKIRQEQLRGDLVKEQSSLEEHKLSKEQLIQQSILTKGKFESLLQNARKEQMEIDSEISRLEKTVREKLRLKGKVGVALSLGWPVDSSRGISTYFHDPSYPFRYVFEHSAIDVRAYQGSYVKAAEDGYIGRAKDGGEKGYSYVMILHDKGIATVYGHISRILVAQDSYVQKGQVIGLSGGAPGTHGAGPYTTGPHLHFEVRVNGIPDDPLKYLP